MRPQSIKAKLVELGVTQRSIAKKLGVSPTAIYQVIEGKSRSRRIERAIARAADISTSAFDRAA